MSTKTPAYLRPARELAAEADRAFETYLSASESEGARSIAARAAKYAYEVAVMHYQLAVARDDAQGVQS